MVLSSLGFSCIVKQAIDAGADDFMVKPVDMDLLVYKLKSFQKESIKKVLSTELVDSL
jgi:DNA-binding response OmpR family regulator